MLRLGGMVPALADMDWGWNHHMWWGGGFVMMILWLLLVVALAALLVRAFDRRPSPGPAAEAEQVLAARFARGEIDETEYRARLGLLKELR